MDILSDSVRASLLLNDEVERERTVIQQEIRHASDEPAQRASQLLSDATYGDQPLGWDIAGDLESVAAITRDDLLTHIATWYQPHNMVLSVAGNIDPDAVLALVQHHWQNAKSQPIPDPAPATDGMAADRVVIEHRDIEQCNLALALRTFPRQDPDRYALTILNDVLGRGMSSRLFLEIRERRGLAYSVASGTARFSDAGHLGIGAGVTSENVIETAEVALLEIERLTREPVGAEELTKSIEHATGAFRLSFETASSHGFRAADSLLMEGRILPINDVIDSLRAVTPDDIQRVAQRFIRRDNLAIAVVGPYDDAASLEALIDG
jgi:predicted Zn-dependent peptidase